MVEDYRESGPRLDKALRAYYRKQLTCSNFDTEELIRILSEVEISPEGSLRQFYLPVLKPNQFTVQSDDLEELVEDLLTHRPHRGWAPL